MNLFTEIQDAHAIAKYPRGVFKQVKVYRRGERVYIPHSGGYIEMRYQEHDGCHSTSHPDVKVLEYEIDGLSHVKHLGQQMARYTKG